MKPTYRTILVGVDFSRLSLKAAQAAAEMARISRADRLHLLHVCTLNETYGTPMPAFELAPAFTQSLERGTLEHARHRLDQLEIPAFGGLVSREARIGMITEELLKSAEGIGADLIVTATHSRVAVARMFMGSTTGALLRYSQKPVLVVGEDRALAAPYRKVLAAVDFSTAMPEVLSHAASFAATVKAHLVVLSAMELHHLYNAERRAALESLVGTTRFPAELTHDIETPEGAPAHAILQAAKNDQVDLIVIGSSGHTALQRLFLGSTARAIVSDAPCPVLVVPKPQPN